MESEIRSMDDRLNKLDSQLTNSKRLIDSGLDDRITVESHNDMARQFNALAKRRNNKYEEYKNLLAETNADIDKINLLNRSTRR